VITFALGKVQQLADKLGQRWYGVTGDTDTAAGMVETNAKDSARRQWEAMGRKYVSPMEAHYTKQTATQDLLDYQTIEQGFRSQYGERVSGLQVGAMGRFAGGIGRGAAGGAGSGARRGRSGGGSGGPAGSQFFGDAFGAVTRWGQSQPGTAEGFASSIGGMGRSIGGFFGGPAGPDLGGAAVGFLGGAAGAVAANANTRFENFQADIQDRTTALGAAFDATTAGISAAVDAAITGSDNIGRAWLRASAMALKALAIENSVRALTAGALAVGAAFFAPASAGAFAKQAAMHAAAAAAAGLGAAALGGMAGGGGGAGYGGSSAPAGGGFAPRAARWSDGDAPMNITVNVHALGVTDRRQTAAVVNDAVHEALAARRTRSSSARVTRYGSGV
jgi:hypothetical protein